MVNFSRRLGLVEHLFATLHSLGGTIYVNIARIQGILSLDVLRAAIDLLQKRHPLLQVHLQESDDGFYFCADGTLAIPLRTIDRQHEQEWLEIAEDEMLQKFSGEFEPLCRITLLQTSEKVGSNELIVTFHHAIADGISVLHFMHELLSYYQQLVEGIPIAPMDALPMLPPLDQLLETCLSEANAADRTQVTPNPTSPSPTLIVEQTAPVGDRRSRLITREFNQLLTSQLKSRCREEQTTVHGALCAAMILASVQQLSSQLPVLVSCGSSVNLRASCFPVVDPSHLGCFVSYVITTHHAEQNTHFWKLARECQSEIHQLISRKVPHRQASNPELLHKYQASSLAQLAEHNMGRNTTTHIANLGQFDYSKSYGPLRLESFHFGAGQNLVGTCFGLGAATVNQKLFCTFIYTAPLISMKTAQSLADSVITILDSAVSSPLMQSPQK
jgi:NRPS condensation-like uncharacterized protein